MTLTTLMEPQQAQFIPTVLHETPFLSVLDVEFVTAGVADGYNQRRLHGRWHGDPRSSSTTPTGRLSAESRSPHGSGQESGTIHEAQGRIDSATPIREECRVPAIFRRRLLDSAPPKPARQIPVVRFPCARSTPLGTCCWALTGTAILMRDPRSLSSLNHDLFVFLKWRDE